MLDSTRQRILMLGAYGFTGKAIQDRVKKYQGEDWSLGHIYKVIADAGMSLWDYRRGDNQEGTTVIKELCMPVLKLSRKRAG